MIFANHFAAAVAIAALSFDPSRGGVDAAVSTDNRVRCIPFQSPPVCVGVVYVSTPMPMGFPNGTVTMVGGYLWAFDFVERLEEGEDDMGLLSDALTGSVLEVEIDDDGSCAITLVEPGDEPNGEKVYTACNSCSTVSCSNTDVAFDCSNLENGRISNPGECESPNAQPFFYPFNTDVSGGETEAPTVIETSSVGDESSLDDLKPGFADLYDPAKAAMPPSGEKNASMGDIAEGSSSSGGSTAEVDSTTMQILALSGMVAAMMSLWM
ncbi:unnamed protein product [Pseudo-nitzschia multistriata]|uniref:Uncharacterized protein n=1 Tax=Pseudo-nitzschia multistriata TaxID=183589 RepID=A0A448ZJB8_9STRA|nr:unnamed protein product [Pseudo-nitzschia multistriata]